MRLAPPQRTTPRHQASAAEFFAGAGLARIGLERAGLRVVWSNDVDPDKHRMYTGHFRDRADGGHEFRLGDVADVVGADVPDVALAWASFPCTDLSLAGNRSGLDGRHSGTFWHFTRVLDEMGARRPPVVALENVAGLASSGRGADLAAALRALNELGYSVDVLAIDAVRFVPQSRPRLFIVGLRTPPAGSQAPSAEADEQLRPRWVERVRAEPGLRTHRFPLPAPPPPLRRGLDALVDPVGTDAPTEPAWWDARRVAAFLDSLAPVQAARLAALRAARTPTFRTAYRRTRAGVPRWELRADEVSGCLRTARGGSSRQALVRAGRGEVAIRWMSAREYARLMGADDYLLDGLRPNQALFGFGDAVAVPVVGWLGANYLAPAVRAALGPSAPAAWDRRAVGLAHGG